MILNKVFRVLLLFIAMHSVLKAQKSSEVSASEAEAILFYNSSFEGNRSTTVLPPYWQNCAAKVVNIPDVQPGSYGVKLPPYSGKTYLSFIGNDDGVVESIHQKFYTPLKGGVCYRMSVYLAKSEKYINQSPHSGRLENFGKPLKLSIYGYKNDNCAANEDDWLVETKAIHHDNWKKYTFFINPPKDYDGLIFKADYAADTTYNGNLLMDNLSALVPVNCSDLKASQSPSGNFRTAMSLLHMLNDVVVDNGKKIEFKKKSPTMTLTEGERNSYLDNILTIFEKYPNYRLIIRIKNSGSLGKARTINIYNYVFKNSKLKAQQIDIDRFKPRDEEVVWLAETDDIVISFDAN